MKYLICIILMFVLVCNLTAQTHIGRTFVLYDKSLSSKFVEIAKYTIFVMSASMVATGAIIDKDKLILYFLPVMTLTVGFYFGQKF